MDIVSPRLQELREYPAPMLFGPPRVVDGWCSLEDHQRSNALRVLREYQSEVRLWQIGLHLLLDGFPGEWIIPDEEPAQQAKVTRIHLLGLEVSSAKAALDMVLAGYYSIAFAAVRHMLEATAQSMFLQLYPDQHVSWDPSSESPPMRRIIDRIKKGMKERGYSAAESERFEILYDSWKLMSKGSHPTGVGLLQVVALNDEDLNQVGPSYRPEFIDRTFDSGLFAVFMLLMTLTELRDMDIEWTERYKIWINERQVARQRMRQRLGMSSDLQNGAVTSDDIEG